MSTDLAYIELSLNGYAEHGLRLATDQGLATRLITRDPAEYAALHPNPARLADHVDQVETYDVTRLLRHVEVLEPEAVIAYDDYRLVQAAVVAELAGLPGPDPRGVLNCRFKDLTRKATTGIGYPVAHQLVPLAGGATASPVGYPCVVKPTDDNASVGVRVCHTDEEFARAATTAIDHATHGRGYRCIEAVLAEELIEGDEYSAELIWDAGAGRWHLLGFTETILGDRPYCQEAAHVFPARLDEATAAKALATVERWLGAVGHRGTAAHVEFKLTATGEPALMEINPRLGGGELRRLIGRTLRADVVDMYQRLWRGLPVTLPATARPGEYAVVRYLAPPRPGKVLAVAPPPGDIPGVADYHVAPIAGTGRKVSPLSRLGWVITIASDASDALASALAFHRATSFLYSS
jgi:biotin carboxylase